MPISICSFSATPLTGSIPLEVTFTDLSIPTPSDWHWDFGDGNISTLQNPTHTYDVAGTYTIVLTINSGTGSSTRVAYIVASPSTLFSGQKITVQGGNILYKSPDPSYQLSVSYDGVVNISNQLNVGNSLDINGLMTTPDGLDLIISTGTGGNLKLQPTAGLLLYNSLWPTSEINSGMFIGASALNTLEFYSYIIEFNGSDTLLQADLNTLYPSAQPGQYVIGPTVVYMCVGSNLWRVLGSDGGGGGAQSLYINTQADDYTVQITDAYNTLIRMTKSTATNLTFANDTDINLPIGSLVLISQNGTGQVTIVPASGVTIYSPYTLNIATQYGKITAIKTAANQWEIEGHIQLS